MGGKTMDATRLATLILVTGLGLATMACDHDSQAVDESLVVDWGDRLLTGYADLIFLEPTEGLAEFPYQHAWDISVGDEMWDDQAHFLLTVDEATDVHGTYDLSTRIGVEGHPYDVLATIDRYDYQSESGVVEIGQDDDHRIFGSFDIVWRDGPVERVRGSIMGPWTLRCSNVDEVSYGPDGSPNGASWHLDEEFESPFCSDIKATYGP